MPKPTATQSEFDKESDKLKADEELRKRNPTMWRELHPPRRGAEGANVDNRPIVDKAKDVQSGVMTLKDLPTKERSAVATYMREHKMEASPKFTADERKRQDQFKQIEPMIGRMANIFEQNPGLQDQGRGGMFSLDAWTSRSKTEKAWQEYSHGLPPADKTLGELIRRAAAIKVMGAGPWMSIGRGKYLYSEIVQHLPATNDTPAQLYDKLQFYRDILEDAKNALPQAQGSEEMLPGEVISQ